MNVLFAIRNTDACKFSTLVIYTSGIKRCWSSGRSSGGSESGLNHENLGFGLASAAGPVCPISGTGIGRTGVWHRRPTQSGDR